MPQIKEVPLQSVPVVEPETMLDEVVELLHESPLHTVVLVNEGQYLGLFNQDALDSGLIPADADYSLIAVGPYVHPVRVIAHPDESVRTVLEAMKRHGLGAAPVVANRTFLGMVTRDDLEKAAA